MFDPDDDRFEAYLKEFRPMGTKPLLLKHTASTRWWAAGIAAVIAVAALVLLKTGIAPKASVDGARAHVITTTLPPQPFTLGAVNATLASCVVYERCLDELSREPVQARAKPEESALHILGKGVNGL